MISMAEKQEPAYRSLSRKKQTPCRVIFSAFYFRKTDLLLSLLVLRVFIQAFYTGVHFFLLI